MRRIEGQHGWLAMFGIVILSLSAFLATPASAADITQARYITPSEFLHSLTQVSLSFRGEGDPLSEYLPVATAQDMVQNALAARGIAVRPNSPVALDSLNLFDVMRLVQMNGKSACVLSGVTANMGLPVSICGYLRNKRGLTPYTSKI